MGTWLCTEGATPSSEKTISPSPSPSEDDGEEGTADNMRPAGEVILSRLLLSAWTDQAAVDPSLDHPMSP